MPFKQDLYPFGNVFNQSECEGQSREVPINSKAWLPEHLPSEPSNINAADDQIDEDQCLKHGAEQYD